MSNKRYTEEFRAEAVEQVTDRGYVKYAFMRDHEQELVLQGLLGHRFDRDYRRY